MRFLRNSMRTYSRSSPPEVLLSKSFWKIYRTFTEEHPRRSLISIKLQSNFIEIALWHGWPYVNFIHIFRTPLEGCFHYFNKWAIHGFFLWEAFVKYVNISLNTKVPPVNFKVLQLQKLWKTIRVALLWKHFIFSCLNLRNGISSASA